MEVCVGDSRASAVGMVQSFLDSRYAFVKKGEFQGGDCVTWVAECCALTKDYVVPLRRAQLSLV